MRFRSLLQKFLVICCASTVLATNPKLVNITIDDKHGDPKTGALITYSPAVSWNDGASCKGCTARFDKTKAYMETWHDGTFALTNATNPTPGAILTASVPFTGSAVYVYCILGHTFTGPDTNTDMTFLLDGQQVGTFRQKPTGETHYDFNVLVYANSSIPHGAHALSIENGHAGEKSLVILDYVVYTGEAEDESSNKTAIIAGSAGGAVGILLIVAAVFFTNRHLRRKQSKPYPLDLVEQFTPHSPREGYDPSWRPTPLDFSHPSAQNLLVYTPATEPSEYLGQSTSNRDSVTSSDPGRSIPVSASSSVPASHVQSSQKGYGIGLGASSEKATLARLRTQNPTEDHEPPPPAYTPSARGLFSDTE